MCLFPQDILFIRGLCACLLTSNIAAFSTVFDYLQLIGLIVVPFFSEVEQTLLPGCFSSPWAPVTTPGSR